MCNLWCQEWHKNESVGLCRLKMQGFPITAIGGNLFSPIENKNTILGISKTIRLSDDSFIG